MKRNSFALITLIIASLLGGAITSFAQSDDAEKTLVFEKYTKPWANNSQFLNVNGNASIDIAVLFNDQGYVDDWVPIRTNDIKLIQSIRNVIGEWKITAPLDDGVPLWTYVNLEVKFQQDGAVVSLTPMEAAMRMSGSLHDDFQLLVPFRELDSIPTPIQMEQPKLTQRLVENNSGAVVKFEFFIDENGKVRMPIVKECDTEEIAAAIMLDSLLKWKFEPPTRKGKPVMTKAIIPFLIP